MAQSNNLCRYKPERLIRAYGNKTFITLRRNGGYWDSVYAQPLSQQVVIPVDRQADWQHRLCAGRRKSRKNFKIVPVNSDLIDFSDVGFALLTLY